MPRKKGILQGLKQKQRRKRAGKPLISFNSGFKKQRDKLSGNGREARNGQKRAFAGALRPMEKNKSKNGSDAPAFPAPQKPEKGRIFEALKQT